MEENEMMTTAEVAARLGLSPRRVAQLKARLGGRLMAGSLFYPRAAVEAYDAAPRPSPGWPKGRPRKKSPPEVVHPYTTPQTGERTGELPKPAKKPRRK